MGRFNLLEEPWIVVIVNDKGRTEKVSLVEFFKNAHKYRALAGEMVTQDFAVYRLLLAVLHTVFSRFNSKGEPYKWIDLDDRYVQKEAVDEDDVDDYKEALSETWKNLWGSKEFPNIVVEYLEKWRDRFYLFDEKYPFYQVTEEEATSRLAEDKSPGTTSGKNINRLISESGNKIALFSPKDDNGKEKNKERMELDELVRWLITLQGYFGLADKTIFGSSKYKASKGWLFDLGGVLLEGDNAFETLLLNMVINTKDEDSLDLIQAPCWEYSGAENIEKRFISSVITNKAELYTNWSRACYIDPITEDGDIVSINVIKLPELEHKNQRIEPMTVWRFNEKGENKNFNTPKKHNAEQAMWRSFGMIALPDDPKVKQMRPGIMSWYREIRSFIHKSGEDRILAIKAISMQDDGNATSWVPTDEILDTLYMDDLVVTDDENAGWVYRITEVVNETKTVIENTYKSFLKDIDEIRKPAGKFVAERVEDAYQSVDLPFRLWLEGIIYSDNKEKKVAEWKNRLRSLIVKQADSIMEEGGSRDYIGIEAKTGIKNIATAYNRFLVTLNRGWLKGGR